MEGSDAVEKYIYLLQEYTDGHKPASDFMHEYISAFKNDDLEAETSRDVYSVLDSLFFACDSFCPDQDPEEIIGGIGEEQFFKEAAQARRKLERFTQKGSTDSST